MIEEPRLAVDVGCGLGPPVDLRGLKGEWTMRETPRGAIVVGTGFGVLTHVRALRAARFHVRALVGRDAARTEDRARRSDVPFGTTSLSQALALPGIAVVAIATPPHTHAEIAIEAARHGQAHSLREAVCARRGGREAHARGGGAGEGRAPGGL